MPLAAPHDEIDLALLMDCFNKMQSLMKNTGQQVTEEKLSELTWVMYQADMMDLSDQNAWALRSRNCMGRWGRACYLEAAELQKIEGLGVLKGV